MSYKQHKCVCGSRVFLDRPVSVINAFGSIIGLGNVKFVECVRCSAKYSVSTDPGRKVLKVAEYGAALERDLMQAAVDGGYFEDAQGKTANMILTDADDQADIDRLCLEVKEELKK
jgi:hypothetical protein